MAAPTLAPQGQLALDLDPQGQLSRELEVQGHTQLTPQGKDDLRLSRVEVMIATSLLFAIFALAFVVLWTAKTGLPRTPE